MDNKSYMYMQNTYLATLGSGGRKNTPVARKIRNEHNDGSNAVSGTDGPRIRHQHRINDPTPALVTRTELRKEKRKKDWYVFFGRDRRRTKVVFGVKSSLFIYQ